MVSNTIYQDIIKRTGGDVYVGVVGPVRTGKSTFIKKFMEELVLPAMVDSSVRQRAEDEMPQSAGGKTVMTTEPKFVPEKGVKVSFGDGAMCSVKLIDCVGYVVPDVEGVTEDGVERLVKTPWCNEAIPFEKAAEMGTNKVIRDHSTIGIVITTDGSFGELGRTNYLDAEDRVINEMKSTGKPFIVVLNTIDPSSPSAIALAEEISNKYSVPAMALSCERLSKNDINALLEKVLGEFPIKQISFNIPAWVERLSGEHPLRQEIREAINEFGNSITCTGDISNNIDMVKKGDNIENVRILENDFGTGFSTIEILLKEGLFYKVLGETTGFEISGEEALITIMSDLNTIKKKYERVEQALNDVEENGYGIVTPEITDLHLDTPEIVKQQGGYGVKLKASAPSIHMIKAQINTEVSPIVGSESQSEDMVKFLLKEFEEDPKKIWESNMFGKSLHELVNEGLNTKLEHMPDEARGKLGETLQRIINEGSSGLICIIL